MGLIKSSQIISLDSNIFIRALDDPSDSGEKARELIEQIKKIAPIIFLSTMVFEEFFVRVYKEKRNKDIEALINFITLEGLCMVVDMNESIALTAAKLRAEYPSLRTPDAIHLASAIESKAKVFITTDRRLPRKIGNLKIEVIL